MVIQRVFFLNCTGLKAEAQLCKDLCGRAVGRRGSGILLSSCTHQPSWQCGCWQSSSLTVTAGQGSSKTDWSFQGSASTAATQAFRSGGRQEEWLLSLLKAYTWCRDTLHPKVHLKYIYIWCFHKVLWSHVRCMGHKWEMGSLIFIGMWYQPRL